MKEHLYKNCKLYYKKRYFSPRVHELFGILEALLPLEKLSQPGELPFIDLVRRSGIL